ncbi:MAG: hypothetical protein K2R98_06270 [Gemmataceae bacterium]|nr:hypothetical protein [Gemmataceae bacterium]
MNDDDVLWQLGLIVVTEAAFTTVVLLGAWYGLAACLRWLDAQGRKLKECLAMRQSIQCELPETAHEEALEVAARS